jgi:O-antigen/teichoic acid export membrane protein
VFLILFPLTVLFVTFSREGLTVWVGAEFAAQSTRVLQWLAVGVFINCLAHVPFALVQAAGRPDWTAKLHLIELPFYLVGVWWLIHARGIEGAAMAWTARVAVDAAILFVMARRLLPECGALPAQAGSCVAIALIVFAIGFIPMSLIAKWLFAVSVLVVFLFVTWAKLFSALA